MKKLLFLSSLLLVVCRAPAGLPFYDPFVDRTASGGTSYAVGTPLETQSDGAGDIWNSLGSNFFPPRPMIAAGNLSYTNLPPSPGNSVSFIPGTNMSVRLNFGASIPNTTTRTYYSFKLKITDISAVPTAATNNYFACLSDGSAGQPQQLARAGARLLTKKSGAGFVLGVGRNNTAADYVYDTTVYNVNDTLFVVGSYDRIGGVTNVNLWVNPPASSFGSNTVPAPSASAVNASSFTGDLNTSTTVQGFVILCQNFAAPSGIIDDVRIGTNWSSVTGGDPAIVQNPSSLTLPPGANATFSVVARGTPTLSYQWYKDGTTLLTDGGNISGATTTSLTISNISPSDTGAYSMFVTNGLSNFVSSASATLSISDPAIVSQPQSRTNNFGTTATFQVTPLGTGPFSYQWHKAGVGDLSDGGNISGSQTNILTITGVSFPDGGDYSVTVTNTLGSVDSAPATLTVNDPTLLTQPASVTNIEGSNVTFSVSANGSGTLTYQWFKNASLLADGGNVGGALTAILGISNISLADAALYNVVVTGSYSSATSSVAVLSVITPVAITAQPSSRTVPAGSKTVVAVGATGWAPLGYQWQFEGVNVSGATAAAYVLTNVQAGVTGSYRVIVSNVLNSVTSSVAVVAIVTTPHFYGTNLAVIRVGDGAQTLTANGNSLFLDQFTGSGSYLNTLNIPDAGPSAMIAMGPNSVPSPSSVTGTSLSRSADGRLMVIAGYNTAVGFSSTLNTSASQAVPRGIGVINSLAQYNLAVASTDTTFNQTFWRSAVTDGTNNYWGAGRTGGTYYFGFDGPAAEIQTVFSNIRSMALFNGNIYCASAVGGNNGILKLDGMPTTAGGNPTVLFPGSTSTSDMEVSPDGNLIYVADDRSAPNGGIQRYQYDGSTWTLVYTLTNGVELGTRYVTADFHGANPIVYAITKELTDENNRIVVIVDTGAGSIGTTAASAGANQNFRGIRFGPVATAAVVPPLLSFSRDGDALILNWSGSFTLQSATNVIGPYADVPSSSSPYTNSFNSAAQLFFRLRQ